MKARGAAVMGAFAVASLGAAYFTWQRPKETRSDTTVTVLDATRSSIEKLRYEDGNRFVELTRQVDGDPVVWVQSGFIPGKEPVVDAGLPSVDAGMASADAGALDAGLKGDGGVKADAGTPPPAPVAVNPRPPPPPIRTVRGNERADKLWEKFAPFEAVRALGTQSEAKLKELGLESTSRRLDVTVAGTTRRFRVSGPTAGVVGTYVLDERDQKVYLLPASLMTDLEPSSGVLVDRRLHAFKAVEFDAFEVTVDGKKKGYVQTDAAIPQTTKVAPKEAPDKPDEFARNWHDKIWNRLIVTDVLGKGELPAKGEPQVVLRVEYFFKGQKKGWLEVAQTALPGVEVFGRSEQTAGWVALHTGVEDMALEAKKLVAETR